ncbi:hypothetical protein GARC_4342 [Paraglaciecola arctica BSs20135]|uniref:Uncharacterized protein n=1 Tax=Paraglaciecola arctica BSs20135 TaxID=493475 RepID=K6XKX3_9ALTE|nr:hypothetical protein GARC_4342 [Paraglaciecola arctica BSs20135]
MPLINLSKNNNFGSFVYWVLALVCFLSGLYLSQISWLQAEWFSRSGCLVVVLGIWSSIGVVFHEKIISRRANWIRNKELRQLKARLLDDSEIALGIDQVNADHDQRLSLAIQDLRLSIGVLEMSLLISGTLVWGFGDLIVQAIPL